jgi:3'(2'), 5'-bisphosphate nucleotidase
MSTVPDFARQIGEIARAAGTAILAIYHSDFAVQTKADASPLTAADLAAQQIILAGLGSLDPALPILSEEAKALPWSERRHWSRYWLVDPLDGTREFTGGGDDFAVNIGLVRNGRPVLGVVGVPATGQIYGGIVGTGAWCQKDGVRLPISARTPPPAGLTVVASRHHGDPAQLDAFLGGRTVAEVVNFGSSLKFCRLAEGKADLYPRFGRTMEWDTCAPQAVLEAAGGAVETLDGRRLSYTKPGWDNPHFVCWGRR